MGHHHRPVDDRERRVLVLAVPDALDTAIALCPSRRAHFVSCAEWVDGATECTELGALEPAEVGYDVAAALGPTHLLLRDPTGNYEELNRCGAFLAGVLAGASATLRRVIQTHPRPRNSSTARYDGWLKVDSGVHQRHSLDIVWHEPLTTTFPDCRGNDQTIEHEHAWRFATAAARTIDRRLRDACPRNLEYMVKGTT